MPAWQVEFLRAIFGVVIDNSGVEMRVFLSTVIFTCAAVLALGTVSVSWSGEVVIAYDDGVTNGCKPETMGNANGVRFTPPIYPAQLVKVRFNTGYNAFGCDGFSIWVLDDDGVDGAPGTTIYGPNSFFVGGWPSGWVEWTLPDSVEVLINDGDFYIAYVEVQGASFDCACLGRDTDTPTGRSWFYSGTGDSWSLLDPAWGNIAIHAIVDVDTTGVIPVYPSSWGRIKQQY